MKEARFIEQHKKQWEELEGYITYIKKKGYKKMQPEELDAYLDLMKCVSHHLSYARTHFAKGRLVDYLNQLTVRANNQLYIVKSTTLKAIIHYFRDGFANRCKQYRAYLLTSTSIFLIAMLIAYIMVQVDSQNGLLFLPEELVANDWTDINTAFNEDEFFFMSSYIMANNIGVAIKAFVYGITAGIMTLEVLWVNGIMLGALTSIVAKGTSNIWIYWSLILPHGVFELAAIFISGGAGLMIGKAIWMPGEYKRKDAIIEAAKEAVMFMPGVIVLLIMAGLIEGFLTPSSLPVEVKLGFALVTFIVLVVYFGTPRKEKDFEK